MKIQIFTTLPNRYTRYAGLLAAQQQATTAQPQRKEVAKETKPVAGHDYIGKKIDIYT